MVCGNKLGTCGTWPGHHSQGMEYSAVLEQCVPARGAGTGDDGTHSTDSPKTVSCASVAWPAGCALSCTRACAVTSQLGSEPGFSLNFGDQ